MNFVALLPVLLESQPTVIPEIWMGHHENGLAFRAALERLTEIRWASLVLGRPSDRRTRPDLRALTVMDDATIFTALRVIDTNRMGIAFVLDSDRHVVGVVTDGDIRHAFVRGINLHDEVGQAMTRTFVHGEAGMSPAELRARLPGRTQVMPILDADGRLVDFASLDTLGQREAVTVKLSDWVFQFLAELGVRHVFMVTGGGAMHLNDSLGQLHGHRVRLHARTSRRRRWPRSRTRRSPDGLGVCLVTAGPGGTNAITGVAGAWLDSTPMLVLSGQAKRADLKGSSGVRQMGVQEVDIVSMVAPITKYAVTVMEPADIRYHLEKAVHLARTGRPGPVWLDLPLDVQGADDRRDLAARLRSGRGRRSRRWRPAGEIAAAVAPHHRASQRRRAPGRPHRQRRAARRGARRNARADRAARSCPSSRPGRPTTWCPTIIR